MRGAAVLALLALTACGEGDPAREAAEERLAEEMPTPAEPPMETLAGEWRVAGINGEPLDEPYGIALSADETEIWWEPRCAGLVRQYRIDMHSIDIAPTPSDSAPLEPQQLPDGSMTPPQPPPVCLIGLPEKLPLVIAALDAADTIYRTPENGVEISGNGRSLTLFAQ